MKNVSIYLLPVAVLFLGLGLMVSPAKAQYGVWDGKTHIVYHVSEEAKVMFALNNIRNHIKGGGGADKLDIRLVVHGPALKPFHRKKASELLQQRLLSLQGEGISVFACGNTMQIQKVGPDDLLPGLSRVEEGGVVKIAELQSKGYLYIRP